MSEQAEYAVSKSVPRGMTAKQTRTLNDCFSYTHGLWNDGLAIILDAKEYTGHYPTYEGMAATVKRFPEFKLLGSDISQQLLKNTLCIAVTNVINSMKSKTAIPYQIPHWKGAGDDLPLIVPVRKSYLDVEARTFTLPMSRDYRKVLRDEAKAIYEKADKVAKAYKKAECDRDRYLEEAVKAYRKDNPKNPIRSSKLYKKLSRELDDALSKTAVSKRKFVSAYIEERKVTFDVPERVDIESLSQISVSRHRHGEYFSIEWKEHFPEHDLPETPAELPQALSPTPDVKVAMEEATRRINELEGVDRVDATIDLNVKNLISCTLLAVRHEQVENKGKKRKRKKAIEVATPFYSFVMDGGWLLSIYRATAKDAAKISAEMDSWKNIRGEKSWQKKREEIIERTDGKKNPSRCRRQRHINAVRDKRRGRYENGKRRADVAIDIIVKCTIAILGAAGVTRVCVGHNTRQKSQSKLKHGSIASQAFQSINYTRIRTRLEHWCGVFGWDYVETEESYTSKVSAYDMEELPCWDGEHHSERSYVGKRISRGLFRTADGTVINADVNGALNIWRKCSLEGRLDRAERLAGVYHPYRVSAEVVR